MLCALALAACDVDASVERLSVVRTQPAVTLAERDVTADPDITTVDTIDDVPMDIAEDTLDTTVPDTSDAIDTPDAPAPPRPPPAFTRPASTWSAIRTALDTASQSPALTGSTFGGLVVDLDSGDTVWQRDPDRLLIPASNTKVITTAAAFALLGPDHRALTRVVANVPIGPDGMLAGNLALHCEHDFTWSRWFYNDEREPLDRMAAALHARGLRKVTGDVDVWGAYLYDGYHYGSYDPASHRARAGAAFVAALRAAGITVSGVVVDHASMAVPDGEVLARWESIPLWVGAWAINRQSHNEMADILARHLGYVIGGSSDYPTGAAVMHDWLASVGVDTSGFVVDDGSGLAVTNRLSVRMLVGAYRAIVRSADGPAWLSSLSVAGGGGPASVDGNGEAIVTTNEAPFNGTMASRLTEADTVGRVLGKSGTNEGITTSGVLFDRYDGHRYAYAFLSNALPSGTAVSARLMHDAIIVALAKDWDARGVRPTAPTLGCVRASASGVRVSVRAGAGFVPEEGVRGYWFETSADGLTWSDSDRIFSVEAAIDLNGPGIHYVRARVEDEAGLSDPSDVYAARAGEGPRVLIVDGDDRWQRQANENLRGASHSFIVDYAKALPDAVGFDVCPNEATTDDTVQLDGYDVVVWMTGEEASFDEPIATAEQAVLTRYREHGGGLFMSGAEIGWALDPRGDASATSDDRTFYETVLGASYDGDDAGVFAVEGVAGGLFEDLVVEKRLGFWTPGVRFVAYPDELLPLGASAPCLAYVGPGTTACIQRDGLIMFGFPFESIDGAAERRLVMTRVLAYLLGQ